MKKIFLLTTVLFTVIIQTNAQEEKKAAPKKEKKESITIHIDGDGVTINGKPADEYKGDLDIHINKDGFFGPDKVVKGFKIKPGNMDKLVEILGNGFNWKSSSNKAFLGVVTTDDDNGAKIKDISESSAAAKAGLKAGDIIIKIDNKTIKGPDELYNAIGKHEPGDKVTIIFIRDGKEETVVAELGKQSNRKIIEMDSNDFEMDFPGIEGLENLGNLKIAEGMPISSRPKLGIKIEDLEEGDGVKILNVEENSAAAKAGLQKNDIITQFNNQNIKDLDKLRRELSDMQAGDSFKIGYKRNGKSMETTIKYPKKLKKADL